MTSHNYWDWGVLVSSAVGALVGSALTLIATYVAPRLQLATQKQNDADQLKGLLQAIHDEVEALWDGYARSAGSQIEALVDARPMLMYWPITQDYFTIYNTNAFFIGRIKDHDLRKAIVLTYARARGLIDSFRMNNDLVHKYEYAILLFQESQNPNHQLMANGHLQVLIKYAMGLKKRHEELKVLVSDLFRRLHKEGVLSKHT